MVLHTYLWYISLFSGCWNIVRQLTTFLLFKTRGHHNFDYIVIHAILYIESTACQHEITNFMVLHNVHNPNSSHQNLFTGLGVERSNPSCRILFTSHQVNLKVKFLLNRVVNSFFQNLFTRLRLENQSHLFLPNSVYETFSVSRVEQEINIARDKMPISGRRQRLF